MTAPTITFTREAYDEIVAAPDYETAAAAFAPAVVTTSEPGISDADLVARVRQRYEIDEADFDDATLLSYAEHYRGGTVFDLVQMIGRHVQERLQQRAAGQPRRDDPVGLEGR
jgi:hypothetical protein